MRGRAVRRSSSAPSSATSTAFIAKARNRSASTPTRSARARRRSRSRSSSSSIRRASSRSRAERAEPNMTPRRPPRVRGEGTASEAAITSRSRISRMWAAQTTRVQGLYYMATGVWPVLSRRSFESVTGPKRDFWLVQTFGLLITVVGGVLVAARPRVAATPELRALAIGSAAMLGIADAFFVARRRIPRVYLVDALLEGAFLAALARAGKPRRTGDASRAATQR